MASPAPYTIVGMAKTSPSTLTNLSPTAMTDRLLAFAEALEEYATKSNEIIARMEADIERMERRIAQWKQ